MTEEPLEQLRRWVAFGGTVEVLARSDDDVLVSLRRCDGGEEMSRVSLDPASFEVFAETTPDGP